jgi:GGDEF domain-containing protein
MCCLLLFAALSSPAAKAGQSAELDATRQPIALADWGEFWIDTGSQREVERVGQAGQIDQSPNVNWQPTPKGGIYPLKPGQALWIRFAIAPTPDAERWLLEIPYPALDRASLYTQDAAGQFSEQRAGDLTAVNRWPMPHRYPLLAVNLSPMSITHYLLRIENAQGFSAPIRFVNARYVLKSEQQTSLFLGFYFGMAVLGTLTGLIGLIWLKDRAYLYYGISSALLGLTLAAITGVAALHVWPNSADWADRSLAVLGVLMLASILLLNATVVSLSERSKRLNAMVWMLAILGVALALLLDITHSALRLKLGVPYLVVVVLVVLSINLWAWRHGDRFGGWLLLSALPFALTWAITTARYLQWIPMSFATEQGGLASTMLQLPALLTVLVLRSRQRRENNRRILGLDRIDPATGLINEDVFAARLIRMIARSEKLRHQSAIVLVDIINTEQTQRDFGRKAAAELPLRVASRLLSTAREIDSAARLSELRFGMLIEGPVSADDAATLGPRIVARCLMPYTGLHEECVAQVRVAYALVPYATAGTQSLISRLEDRLATALSSGDKRAVFAL